MRQMRKKIKVIVLIVLIIFAILAILRFVAGGLEDNWICVNGEWVRHGNPSALKPVEPCSRAVAVDKPDANIVIESPVVNEMVGKNIVITGKARVFENQLNWAVLDAKTKKELATGTAYTSAEDIGLFGPFEIKTALPDNVATSTLLIQVFDYSAKDGLKTDVAEVRVNFEKNPKNYYEVYFSNNKLDPEISCIKTFPVVRSAGTEKLNLQRAIEFLLQGVNFEEKEAGYFSGISDNVKINSIQKGSGFVKIDFSGDIERGVAGSCRVISIRSQIIKTVWAFDPGIRSVNISVEGNSESSLQP